jgi:pimeloyl-ACP methyl ester carboxylesterase
VLLHGVGTSAGEWTWVLPALARNNLVYAVDLPGYDGSSEPSDYSPAYTARFIEIEGRIASIHRESEKAHSRKPTLDSFVICCQCHSKGNS